MPRAIAGLYAEVRVPDAPLTPEEYLTGALEALAQYAASVDGETYVIRTNSFYEPEAQPAPEDPNAPVPLPDDGGDNGGDG